MKKILSKLLIIYFISAVLAGSTSAATWYVDNSVATSGDGQSWGSAWKAFSNIAWASVHAGDTVYISGGTTSQTYSGTLSIGNSGDATHQITMTKGVDAAHDGTVIINGPSGASCISVQNRKYITISGFTITNCGEGITITGGSVASTVGIIIENNYIVASYGRGIGISGLTGAGDMYNYIQDIVVRNNYITTLAYDEDETDTIYAQGYQNLTIEHNYLSVLNTEHLADSDCGGPTQHIDAIQTNRGKDLNIGYNFINYTVPRYCSQTFMLSWNIGTTNIYDNIVYSPNGNIKAGIGYKDGAPYPVFAGPEKINIYNNVFISNNSLGVGFDGVNYTIKNNIFYSMLPATPPSGGISTGIVAYWDTPADWSQIDYNLYYGLGNTIAYLDPAGYPRDRTITQLRSYGAETHGMKATPQFVNFNAGDFRLVAGSPGIDQGVSLPSLFAKSYDSVSRPQGAGWDIGAYEYISGVTFDPADTNQNGCISLGEMSAYVQLWLNNQITLPQVSSSIAVWLQHGC